MINILILNYNSSNAVQECMDYILQSDHISFRVILIDNYSTSVELNRISYIYDRYRFKTEIHLVRNDYNKGYAGGNNTGIRFLEENNLEGDIMILNPDVQVSINTISEMKRALNGAVGIVTVRTLTQNKKIAYDAIRLNGLMQKSIITDKEIVSTDYSQGSCLMISRSIIENIGLFDERFFLYWEDVDFSIRVKKSGRELISLTTTSVVRNKNNIMRQPLAFYYSVRNARLIKEKHPELFSDFSYIIYLFLILILTLKFVFKPVILLQAILNYFSGLSDSIKGKYYAKS